MTFSDDNLKQLKDYYEDPRRGDAPLKWRALLARLEAAEALGKEVGYLIDAGWNTTTRGLLFEAWKAWRKAAGK